MLKNNTLAEYPIVSIVTPSYNQGQFIEDNILSVKNQDYPNIEHIIVDGGSTDDTLEILKRHEGTYNLRWICEPDEGQAQAVNKGIKLATGQWIGWQNSDDFYLPNALNEFYHALIRYPDYRVFYGNAIHVDGCGVEIKRWYYTRPSKFIHRYAALTLYHGAAFLRRDVFTKVGLLDERLHFAMDHEFYWRLLGVGIAMKHVSSFWGVFRHHGASKSSLKQARGDIRDLWRAEHWKIYNASRFPDRKVSRWLVRGSAFALRTVYLLLDNGLDPFAYKLFGTAMGAGKRRVGV